MKYTFAFIGGMGSFVEFIFFLIAWTLIIFIPLIIILAILGWIGSLF